MGDQIQAEKTLTSKTLFEGKLVNVRVDSVRLPDGGEVMREVVEHGPAVVIVPIDADNNVILVRQYRYAVGHLLLEAPAGNMEEWETPEECAQRELQEETGFVARSLEALPSFWGSPGFSTELMHAFLAVDLVPSSMEPDADESINVEKVSLSRIWGLIRQGEIQDGKSIATLLMAGCVFEQG